MLPKSKIQLDSISYFFLFGAVLSTLLLNNGIYMFACFGTLFLLYFQVQKPYFSGAFGLILFQHLLQIIVSVIQANYLNQDINYRSPQSDTAILLSLGGIVALFVPIIYFQNKLPEGSLKVLQKHAASFSTDKVMYFYIGAFFATFILIAIAFLFPGMTQIIISLAKIKWLFFLLFGFLSIIKNERKTLFYIFIGLEFVLGFFSYFSEFKTVIYYLLILLATFIVTINFKYIVYAFSIGVVLIFFALLWSNVKGEYRLFLNAGSGQQTVDVSREQAMNKLYDLSSEVDQNSLQNSTNDFLDRLQYTYHFAKAIERVPDVIPYQNGANWSEVLQYTTTPRFLNPDKPTVDNSIKASKYTGIRYAGAKKGVSFSLGYFAECYIDFGYLGMMVPLLLIGLIYGKLYHFFITKATPNLLFNYAIVGSFFMEFYAYEMDATILTGRLFASTVTYFLLIYTVFPTVHSALLVNPPKKSRY